jgi:hypothetical protein
MACMGRYTASQYIEYKEQARGIASATRVVRTILPEVSNFEVNHSDRRTPTGPRLKPKRHRSVRECE